jgi:hypothetical protein
MDAATHLRALYEAFNGRDVDAVLAAVAAGVDWPNAWEGGRIHGREAVRAYWMRQWAEIDPRVEPLHIETLPDGRVAVDVEQTVLDRDGRLIGAGRVRHVFELRDGLVARMDVEEP